MGTQSSEFPQQNKIFIFFNSKMQLQIKDDKFKEENAKNRIEKPSFFNEISLEYKAKKLPQDHMEREENQIFKTESHKEAKISITTNIYIIIIMFQILLSIIEIFSFKS